MSIPQFIGAVLDNFIMILGGGYFIYLYKKKQNILFILIGIFPICFGIYQMSEKYQQFTNERVPSKNYIKSKIGKQSISAIEDIEFISDEGYKILIPKGYNYTEFSTTAISLIAINEAKASSISVSNFKVDDSLSNIINDANNYLKEKNPSYKSKDPIKYETNGLEGKKVDFEVIKSQGLMKGYFVYYQAKNILFQITFSCLKNEFSVNDSEFKKVLESFSLKKNKNRESKYFDAVWDENIFSIYLNLNKQNG